MNNDLVEEDIRHFVHSDLHSDPSFGRWPRDLLNEAEESITKGAKGMQVSPMPSRMYRLRLLTVNLGFAGPYARLTLFND